MSRFRQEDRLSHAELLQLLQYEPETGVFRYKVAGPNRRIGRIAGTDHACLASGLGSPAFALMKRVEPGTCLFVLAQH